MRGVTNSDCVTDIKDIDITVCQESLHCIYNIYIYGGRSKVIINSLSGLRRLSGLACDRVVLSPHV